MGYCPQIDLNHKVVIRLTGHKTNCKMTMNMFHHIEFMHTKVYQNSITNAWVILPLNEWLKNPQVCTK